MKLLVAINENLSEELLTRLARATATPLAATADYCGLATVALVRQLAQPTDLNELNARWDMCRQLFLSQVLTDADELLRTDMGWPDRRHHLAQNFLGPAQVAALTEAPGLPAQARALLGYLTILALATVGQHAQQANLIPAALGEWLSQQQVPAAPAPALKAVAPAPAPKAAAPVPAPKADTSAPKLPAPAPKAPIATPSLASQKVAAPASQPAPVSVPRPATPVPAPMLAPTAAGGSQKVKILSVVGALAVAGLAGGYFLSGTPANATQQAAAAAPAALVSVAASAAPAAPAAPAEAKPAGSAVASKVVATPVSKLAAAKAATHAPDGPVLVDTIGNAALAAYIGGGFSAAQGRYPKGEGQPLNIKLINRATLTVGINSSESLLYKRLVNPSLARPSSVALDRLAFDQGQAKLGAEGAQQLGNVATLLKTFPKAHLLVLGHATTSEAEAMRLSLQRANTAIEELVKQGISADRLQAQGLLATGMPTAPTAAEKQALRQGISLSVSRL